MQPLAMATVEMADSYVDLRFGPHGIAFLTDAIVIERYLEIDGQLRRAMGVVKLHASPGLLRKTGKRDDGQYLRSKATSGVRGR
jgi:circadian clock protein KaiC